MPDRLPAGSVEVWISHNGATDPHTFTCTNARISQLRTPGREQVALKVSLDGGADAQGQPVLDAGFASFAWYVIRPASGGGVR